MQTNPSDGLAGHIHPPVLTIDYDVVLVTDVRNADRPAATPDVPLEAAFATLSFSADYTMDMASFWQVSLSPES